MKLLKLEGYEVHGAASAFEALAVARQNQPDLVLLDVMIPQLDGLTLLMLLREDPQFRQLPVVILTGVCDEHTLARARDLGVRDYLLKAQFSPEQLMGVIRRNLTAPTETPEQQTV
jgi:CheY-like chemotaxis protein